MSLAELRKELRELRKAHCPPVSRMKKADIAKEVERIRGVPKTHMKEEPVEEKKERIEKVKAKKVEKVKKEIEEVKKSLEPPKKEKKEKKTMTIDLKKKEKV